ncbi:hypothetical protein LMG26696_00296 [Achromobacter pulmonis]|uniref:hypothetical protein n=1 Tax=Achromobacter pulmonis TaxID=1389932 RepID=UPI0014675C9B|nr:hypothetical protein [Achromobacter pulmonis]CAB3625810.1 hypothetical protein LMG26696_00296 [Achromobacter pulmonis]
MNDAAPISQADYDLPLETLEAHLLAQRQRAADVVKAATRNWTWVRHGAFLTSIVIVGIEKLVTGKVGAHTAVFASVMLLMALSFIAAAKTRRIIKSLGSGQPTPKWVLKRMIRKTIFKGASSLKGTARFYPERFVLDQNGIHFESEYENDKIALIALTPDYLQIIPVQRQDVPDEVYFIPLAQVSQPEALLNFLGGKPNYVDAA